MKAFRIYSISFLSIVHCSMAQVDTHRLIGGPCEGCEAIFEYGNRDLSATDTLPLFEETSPQLRVHGTVYESDGKTPAEGVILYIYHTNREGVYPTKGNEKGWARRHGYIRGWIKTDSQGRYEFLSFKPGTYPSETAAAHIHLTVLEPDGKYYWLSSYHFADDPLLQRRDRNPSKPRGGPGSLLDLRQVGNMLEGTRDIILGRNIDNY